ncbi:hypothetical protein LCGC14_2088210 [marine sediment metagenome]|uniref:Uncharacterized protein n=1 Tax=marine sediment metagenome TaxID=412755 RepID=A0A0F9EDS7_9ZZZZ
MSSFSGGGGDAAAGGVFPTINTGTLERYVLPGWGFGGVGSGSPSNGRLYYIPIYVGRTITYDRIGLDVNTAAPGRSARIGIYNMTRQDSGAIPGTLVLDAGTVDLSATGVKEINISQELAVGYYYLAYVQTGGAGVSLEVPASSEAVWTPVTATRNVVPGPFSGVIQFTSGRGGDVGGGLPTPAPAVDNNSASIAAAYLRLREVN